MINDNTTIMTSNAEPRGIFYYIVNIFYFFIFSLIYWTKGFIHFAWRPAAMRHYNDKNGRTKGDETRRRHHVPPSPIWFFFPLNSCLMSNWSLWNFFTMSSDATQPLDIWQEQTSRWDISLRQPVEQLLELQFYWSFRHIGWFQQLCGFLIQYLIGSMFVT